ncbi:MAG: archease [Deferrisomatales bacterium]
MGTWRTVEHTADLALEARGETPAEALEALCRGLMAQITDPATVAPREATELVAEGFDGPETLVTALGELLYLVNGKGWLFSAFRVHQATETRIRLTAFGEPRDAARHPFHHEVKAATYHRLRWGLVPPAGPGWEAAVLFDV